MAEPVAADVAAFLGRSGDAATVALAEQHLPVIRAMVKAYTRGRGFTDDVPADDVALIIVSSCARLVSNPAHTVAEQVDDFSVRHAVFDGWTLPELAVLHQYRRRAA